MSYVVPTYKPSPGVAWMHFLHGNVPGHQIDFIYRPEVPAGPLTQQHFSHLARLVKYIEPRHRSAYAFAIGNLSRDDTQYEPGHGAVALIFGLRIRGAKDHAGRQDPPFCHAAVAVDRHLDAAKLYEAAVAFYQKLLPDEESQAEGSGWYHTYLQCATNQDALEPLLRVYVADFEELPAPGPSQLGRRWTTPEGVTPPKRVVIVHGDRPPFEGIAACAARIAGVLVESDVRWTVISNGRDADVPGGVSVRFVPAQEVAGETADALVLRLEEVPEGAEEIAAQLFGARAARRSETPEQRVGWRQRAELQAAEEIPIEVVESERGSPGTARAEAGERGGGGGAAAVAGEVRKGEEARALGAVAVKVEERAANKSRSQVKLLVGIGVALALGGGVGGGEPHGSAQPAEAPSEQVNAVATGMVIEPPKVVLSAAAAPGKTVTAAGSGEKAPVPATATASGAERPPVSGGKKPFGKQNAGDSVIGAPLKLKR
jgi:hypothetical protein